MTNRLPLVLSASKEPQQLQTGDELVVPQNPLTALGVAPKQYVDSALSAIGSGLVQRTVTASTTLVATDGLIFTNSASANNVTIPPNSSVAFAVPSIIQVVQWGAGKTTIVAGSGVTIIGEFGTTNSLRTAGAGCSLIQRATDTWHVVGEMDNSTLPSLGTFTASQALAAGDLVNTYNNAGVFSCRKADGSAANKYEAHGFTLAAVSNGGTATVYAAGLNSSLTSLLGGTYYLSATTPGGVVTSAVAANYGTAGGGTAGQLLQKVGIAISATSLVFVLGDVIVTA